jgi:radical SAM protein with 4Fe4S-binding SPASM domain
MIEIKPNANFYSLCGSSAPKRQSKRYKEYRKKWMDNPKKFIVSKFPIHLDIESTNRCNLRCTFCDKLPYLRKDQIGDMDIDLYRKIIDEGIKHGLMSIKLSYRGEPLIYKNIVEMVSYAKKKGILDIYFNTNGMLLNEKMSESLIDAGLDRISISIEGTDPVAFEEERRGAKFLTIEKNVENLRRIRNKKNADIPRIRVQTVLLERVDLEEYRRYWEAKCDEVSAIDYKDSVNRQRGIKYGWACPQLWQRMTIEWDGTVFPCNNCDVRSMALGNCNDGALYEFWHSPEIQKMREAHKNGESDQIEACDGCPWRTTQIVKSKEKV